MPDLDKLFIKFYKVKSEIKRHNATLTDVVKVYNFVLHSSNIIEYLSKFFIGLILYFKQQREK